ncbi:DUF2867 domain-containing protein [Sciscionella sediminilitoris]|uniref:DUF2867 domain-containing protein n=1 Tax=Sciscionella sediminilitoris TaxID=1445613 RepID=UPI0004DF69AF|nr:DUF2867 domain-containing protein [Sciscionella sp. SE31]
MKLPRSAHTGMPWRIHELTRDFRLEDVWALPTPGAKGDLHLLAEMTASGGDRGADWPPLIRALWALRWKLGGALGWDREQTGLGARVPSLRERMPADLRDAPRCPGFATLPFRSLYLLEDEWAAELANSTVHAVMHIGWVPDRTGEGYHARMAVLVRPNGLLGRAYMAAIAPLRHLLVYPAMMSRIGREWRRFTSTPTMERGRS